MITVVPLLRTEPTDGNMRSEEHTSELQSHVNLVCRLLLEKKKRYHQTRPGLQRQDTPRAGGGPAMTQSGTAFKMPWSVLPDYRCFGCSPRSEEHTSELPSR